MLQRKMKESREVLCCYFVSCNTITESLLHPRRPKQVVTSLSWSKLMSVSSPSSQSLFQLSDKLDGFCFVLVWKIIQNLFFEWLRPIDCFGYIFKCHFSDFRPLSWENKGHHQWLYSIYSSPAKKGVRSKGVVSHYLQFLIRPLHCKTCGHCSPRFKPGNTVRNKIYTTLSRDILLLHFYKWKELRQNAQSV